jgi:hypothetical protein
MEKEVKLISGMVFKTLEEAKDQIRNYLIQNHITAKVIKSEKIKYEIRCRGSTEFKCPFKVRVSFDKKKGCYVFCHHLFLREFDESGLKLLGISGSGSGSWLPSDCCMQFFQTPGVKTNISSRNIDWASQTAC